MIKNILIFIFTILRIPLTLIYYFCKYYIKFDDKLYNFTSKLFR